MNVYTLELKCILAIFVALLATTAQNGIKNHDMDVYKQRVVDMFQHAYDGYLTHAYPYDELRPLTCDGHDTWGSYSLTLIDALDTLAIMGNYSEFRRVADLLVATIDFNQDINVSVFETNIRGGLLSAHLLSKRAGMELEVGWPCTGPLLRLAERVGRKLLPAFQTNTSMAFGTVNLLHGVPASETPVTCTAGVGTFLVEFGALSRLTGDPVFEQTALKALDALWSARSPIGLVGNHIDVMTGAWTAVDSGIGAGIDSYYEYLVKGSIMFQNTELKSMFNEYREKIDRHMKREDWYMWANMNKGAVTLPVFQSLEAFWPGLLALTGDIDQAMKTIHNYHQVWKQFGFTPEFYNIPKAEVHPGREGYPLRPELIESVMYLYQATRDPFLIEVAVDILESIETETRTKCGYATVKDVRDHRLENRMESFFLAETTKYLYLIFDENNFIHNTGDRGTIINTPSGECVIDAGGYVFNTEAHPIDVAALYCCSADRHSDLDLLYHLHDNVNLLELLGLDDLPEDYFGDPSKKAQRQKEKNRRKRNMKRQKPKVHLRRDSKNPRRNKVHIVEVPKGRILNSEQKETEVVEESNSVTTDNDKTDSVDDQEEMLSDEGICDAIEVMDYRNEQSMEEDSYYESRLLTCPASPFHMRLSLMGEMFPNN